MRELQAFVGSAGVARLPQSRVMLRAEEAASSSEGESTAIVQMTEENKVTTAGVLGGLIGLALGGVWVGAGLFVATSYLARRDDDISDALKGVAASGLSVLNYGSYLNGKYTVTDKVGESLENAVGKENLKVVDGLVDTVKAADKEVKFKDTLGSAVTTASSLAKDAVDKVVDVNKEYKITDQVASKIDEVTKSVKK